MPGYGFGYPAAVLPAYAGMILPDQSIILTTTGAPRVCGDDPKLDWIYSNLKVCSPRMRG